MTPVLLWVIECYWRLVPPSRRRTCLFRVTCSTYVYNTARSRGALAGISAIVRRLRQCRRGFSITFDGEMRPSLHLADGSVLPVDEASDSTRDLVQSAADAVQTSGPKATGYLAMG